MTVPAFDNKHERSGHRIESVQGQTESEGYYFDAVGRRRKLAAGAMSAIQREFEKGIPTKELAERYGVSTNLILTICYFTPKGAPVRRPELPDKKPVIYPVPSEPTGTTDD